MREKKGKEIWRKLVKGSGCVKNQICKAFTAAISMFTRLFASIFEYGVARALRFLPKEKSGKARVKIFSMVMVFLVLAVGVYAATVSHTASEIVGGTFNAENFAFQNNLTVDTDTLYVDSTSDRVGIGTTGPGTRLQIDSGSATEESLVTFTKNATAYTNGLTVGSAGATNDVFIGSAQHDGVIRADSGKLLLGSGWSDVDLAIDTNGNVGIGTTSPEGKLNVLTTPYVYQETVEIDPGLTPCVCDSDPLTADCGGAFETTDNLGSECDDEYLDAIQKWRKFRVVNIDSLVVNNNGNVGIGTTNPGNARLNVSGDTYIDGDLEVTGSISGGAGLSCHTVTTTSTTKQVDVYCDYGQRTGGGCYYSFTWFYGVTWYNAPINNGWRCDSGAEATRTTTAYVVCCDIA